MRENPVTETEGKLPEPPLELVDVLAKLPKITQAQLVVCYNARNDFRIAQAKYEVHRAAITFRLLYGCGIEPGDISAMLNGDGELVLSDANVQ